ncbi:uncharacterized protein TNCV_3359421 [Trichonephila clavipes]|nr:uncharacterized protein TNCV_3359421 [Trichonephila clavipes]
MASVEKGFLNVKTDNVDSGGGRPTYREIRIGFHSPCPQRTLCWAAKGGPKRTAPWKRGMKEAAVAEWYKYRIVACLVTSSSPVPLKTRRVEQRCTLNLSRAETSSRWCGMVVRRGGVSSGVVHVT